MTARPDHPDAAPALLCFDGSEGAIEAINRSAALLAPAPAVVLTVSERLSAWEPSDPSPISAAVTKLGSRALALDEIAADMAKETLAAGVTAARNAGFDASGRLETGKPWQAICDVAEQLATGVIVIGARGLSRVESLLLGSVSRAVVGHATCPVMIVPRPAVRNRR